MESDTNFTYLYYASDFPHNIILPGGGFQLTNLQERKKCILDLKISLLEIEMHSVNEIFPYKITTQCSP